jgi:glycosyltransferase involved in cell wall biosynthesis
VKDFRTLISLYRLARRNRYDIVHTHIAKAGILGRLAARAAGVPVTIHSLHGITFPPTIHPVARSFYTLLERLAATCTTHYISVGEELVSLYRGKGIGRPEGFTIIRSGMDLNYFRHVRERTPVLASLRREMGIRDGESVIGYVAALEPRKGHVYCTEAAAKIVQKHPETRFLFVGEGHLKKRLIEDVRERGLENRIVFTGYRDDIAEIMALFDIKVFTSLWEGLPQALVQSAAIGIPIVSFDTTGVREIVHDGSNGYVVPMKDVEALTRKVCSLLDDLSKAREMGLQGRHIVNSDWEISTMVGKTAEVYRRLYESKTPPT